MVRHHKDLHVYQQAYGAALAIFELSKAWPREEQYALTDQVRRSARSVCTNIAEAWAKRLYPRHFVSKLTDAYGETLETGTWLDFARDHGYLDGAEHQGLGDAYKVVCSGLLTMINAPQRWCLSQIREPEQPYDPTS